MRNNYKVVVQGERGWCDPKALSIGVQEEATFYQPLIPSLYPVTVYGLKT